MLDSLELWLKHLNPNMLEGNPHGRFFKFFIKVFLLQGLCLINMAFCLSALASNEKQVIGWVEKVQLLPGAITVHAKIDTGADNSSLHVNEITEYIRQGESWVRFSFAPKFGKAVTMKRKVYRYARVKQKAAESQERPVILLGLCLGGLYQPDMEVNLTDRTNFKYNMLIGRSVLAGRFIIDPSVTYTMELSCPQTSTHE